VKALGKGNRDLDGFTIGQRLAVERFLIHGKRALAWREAGLGCGTSKDARKKYVAAASLFFNKPKVQAFIEREYALRRQLYRPQESWVLEQLGFMVRFKVTDIYDEDGRLKQPHELDDITASCVTQIEFHEPQWNEKLKKFEDPVVKKYHFTSKTEAVLMAMKHLHLLGESMTPPPAHAPVLNVQFVFPTQPQLTAGEVQS
jgi:hypothetical protein